MRFGCCCGVEAIEAVAHAGFDYVELPVSESLAPEAGPEYVLGAKARLDRHGLKAEVLNFLIPDSLGIVGPNVDLAGLTEYVQTAMDRAPLLGAKLVVLGSAGARSIPEGFPEDRARAQLTSFVKLILARGAGQSALVVAVEPIRGAHCNSITTVQEAVQIVREINLPAIKVMIDLCYLGPSEDPAGDVLLAAPDLAHIHLANPDTRRPPMPDDGADYCAFFKALKGCEYDSRISLQCQWGNIAIEARRALELIKSQWQRA